MAIGIPQTPTLYNAAYVPNVYTLDGLDTEPTAVQYALTIQIDGQPPITFQQPPNPSGVAHFDVSKVLQSYLSPKFVSTTPLVTETEGETLSYIVRYGFVKEDGFIQDVQFPGYRYVINAYDSWRTLNWDDSAFNPNGSLQLCESSGSDVRWNSASFLTNYPKASYPLRSDSYHTLSFFNRIKNGDDGTNWDGTSIVPGFVRVKFYTEQNGLIQTSLYSINAVNGLGPRQSYDNNVLGNWNDAMRVGTVGVGPQNLKDGGIWPSNGPSFQIWNQITQTFGSNTNIWNLSSSSATVAYYTVEILSINQCYWNANGAPQSESVEDLEPYVGTVIYNWQFNIENPCSNFDPITVAFVNQYGCADYFTFDRRNVRQMAVNRNNYNETLGSWNEATFSIDEYGRGRRTFSTNITEEMTLSTNWMDDATSKWLEELFTSPSVSIYVDGKFQPSVISSNSYEQKTYSRDRMFQHTITIAFANDKKVQRG